MTDTPTSNAAELLAVVEVDKSDRVVCQAPGCGHTVYKRIHVVRQDGRVNVYGSDCFEHIFGAVMRHSLPQYGSGEARALTPEEREMLAVNTERLVAQFEAEHQLAAEAARLRLEQEAKLARVAAERAERARAEAERRRPPTSDELASVEQEAKRLVRAQYDVDPNLPGWRGLVMVQQLRLLGT